MDSLVSKMTVDEIVQLKDLYPKNCRVMQSVGDFAYVINLQLPMQNIRLKFQLTEFYPEAIPCILIMSPDLSPDFLDMLKSFLISKAKQSKGKPMICDLVNETISWLQRNSFNQNIEKKNNKKSKAKNKIKCESKNQTMEEHSSKKASMRTAIDVISRILWDENLPTEEFWVGYLDRFSGIQEKPFSAFSWEDVASVDYHTLAIPKHRICYFKYKTVKIWDKAQRLDLVFGSTGATTNLADVIANCNISNLEDQSFENVICKGLVDKSTDDTLNTKADFFITIRIKDEIVRQRVAKLQYSIIQEEPTYKDCFVHPSLLHVTLCALCLKTTDNIATAVQIFKNCKQELSDLISFACPLTIIDVRHFSNRVLYARIEAAPQFLQLVDFFKSLFQNHGFLHIDCHETFQPHMTLFKLSKAVMHQDNSETINNWICERYSGFRFGEQNLDNVHLCAMENTRQEDGFYLCPASLDL